MLHPSYGELIEKVNVVNKERNLPEINSRYSIVIAAARRARTIIDGDKVMIEKKERGEIGVLSKVVDEMDAGKIAVIMEEGSPVAEKHMEYDEMAVVDFSRDMEDEE